MRNKKSLAKVEINNENNGAIEKDRIYKFEGQNGLWEMVTRTYSCRENPHGFCPEDGCGYELWIARKVSGYMGLRSRKYIPGENENEITIKVI
jgi:hypothetical protein